MVNLKFKHAIAFKLTPLRIALIYIVLGGVWIFLSDLALKSISLNTSAYTIMQTSKGWIFVIISGLVVFMLVKQSQAAIEKKDRLLHETGRMAKIGGWEFDAETGKGTWTDQVARIHDIDAKQQTNVELGLNFYHGEHRIAIEKAVNDAIAFGVPYELELELVTAKGERKWVKTMGYPIKEDDKVISIRGIIQDITEQRQQKTALRISEDKFRTAFEHSLSGMALLDIDGVMKDMNDELCDMLGYDERELEGQVIHKYIHPDDKEMFDETVKKVTAGEVVSGICQLRLRHKTDDAIWADMVSVLLRDDTGTPSYIIIQIDDVTESKKAAEELVVYREHLEELVNDRTRELGEKARELEHANIRLQEIDRLKSVFLASMSHELRTPLNSIIGFTGVLLMGMSGALNDEQKKQLTMVKYSAQHLLNLINDILDISKIESGKVDLALEEFTLNEIVHETTSLFSQTAVEKNIDLLVDIPEKIVLFSDKRRIKQIIINLLNNAIKFTEEGYVKVSCNKAGNFFELLVIDTGIGIKREEMHKLFHPFQQIDESLTKKHDGTGLGLHLVKNLVSLLGGDVFVHSEYGKGSEFVIKIPLIYRKEYNEENSHN